MQSEKKTVDTLKLILAGAEIVEPYELDEAAKSAERMNVSLARALIMIGHVKQDTLKLPLEAENLVDSGKASVDLAIKALRLATQDGIELAEAIHVLTKIHEKTTNKPSRTSPYAELMLHAEIITGEQLDRALLKSQETKMALGRVLILNRETTSLFVAAAINAQLLIRDQKISQEQALKALKFTKYRHVTLEQALFELDIYCEQPGQTMRLGELFAMAGHISESDMLECLELHLLKKKELGQILLEQGFVTSAYLEAAIVLQNMASTDSLKPYQAAEALKQIRLREVSVYQAVAELDPPPQVQQANLRIGDLLALSGMVSRENVERVFSQHGGGAVRIGKLLLNAGLISEFSLYNTLRCLSLLRQGYISNEQAITTLKYCQQFDVSPDEALPKISCFPPSRMQWVWA